MATVTILAYARIRASLTPCSSIGCYIDFRGYLLMFTCNDTNDDYLYHYTKSNTAIEHIITNNLFRFTPFNESTDPKESREIMITHVGDKETDIEKFFMFNNRLNEIISTDFKVACFCKDYNDEMTGYLNDIYNRGYAKPRMWNQYGDNHKGVCLVFSKKIIQEIIDSDTNKTISFSEDVSYDNHPKDIKKILYGDEFFENIDDEEIEKKIIDRIRQNRETFFFNKKEDYKDEKEYRIVVCTKTERYYEINFEKCCKAIVLGSEMNELYKRIYKSYGSEKNIPIAELIWHNEELICTQ